MQDLSAERIFALHQKLNLALAGIFVQLDQVSLLEPQFTRQIIHPVLEREINELSIPGLRLRGDGCSEQAVPVRALGLNFYPDLAISFNRQLVWALEVKFLRDDNSRQNAFCTAIGQLSLYETKYASATGFFVDWKSSSESLSPDLLTNLNPQSIYLLKSKVGQKPLDG